VKITGEEGTVNRTHLTFTLAVLPALFALGGCSSGPDVIPKEFESQIDSSLTFSQIMATPSAYSGRTVLLGGEILSAKRLPGSTQLEVLQLPVKDEDPPAEKRSESQGRFLAMNHGDLDPAALPPGTRVTLVGQVTGESVQRLDESDYRYPTVEVKHLYVWDADAYERNWRSNSRVGIGFGVGAGGGRSGSFGGVGIGTGY
jgi:outer membrane lipoprotein